MPDVAALADLLASLPLLPVPAAEAPPSLSARAPLAGEVAARLLGAGSRVAVLLTRSAYLACGVCLAAPDVPLHPLVIRLDPWPRLRIGQRIDVAPAELWRPPNRRADRAALAAALPAEAAILERLGSRWAPAPGFDRFRCAVAGLPDSAGELLGFGPGLTPAGDDVLAGHALLRPGLEVRWRETSGISARYLACALAGLPGEDEAHLLAAPDPAAAERVASHGATSGLALLLGMRRALVARPLI